MLWVCEGCTARYSVGAPRCPQCGGVEYYEEGSMPKAHRDREPTYESDAASVPVEGTEEHLPEGVSYGALPEADGGSEESVSEPSWDDLSYRDLQDAAKLRGLPANGSKDDLVERLRADDREQADTAAAEEEPGGDLVDDEG
jgi:hypothetical protein